MDIMTMHLVYLKYILDCPLAWTPDFGNREFPILVEGFMDINTMHLVLFSTYVEVQKIFENMVLFAYLVPSLRVRSLHGYKFYNSYYSYHKLK